MGREVDDHVEKNKKNLNQKKVMVEVIVPIKKKVILLQQILLV